MAKKSSTRKSASRATGRKAAGRKGAAKKSAARKTAVKRSAGGRRRATAKSPRRRAAASGSVALADVRGAETRRDIGGVRLEVGRAGEGRVKRMIYPPGYRWSVHTKPHVGTDYCMHAHVGFLTQGRIDVMYADGCVEVYEAPQIVAVVPGHDGHVVGDEPAVLIEFDFEGETAERFGMPDAHRHD